MAIEQFPAPAGLTRLAVISSSQTWTHPDGASSTSPKPVFVIAVGGGGGGGSGASQGQFDSSSYLNNVIGGGGGGGAGNIEAFENLVYAPVTVTIGAGGSGGTGIGNGGSQGPGNPGSNGGNTSFGTDAIDSQVRIPILALGGQGGQTGAFVQNIQATANAYIRSAPGGVGSSIGGEGIIIGSFFDKAGYSAGAFGSGFPGFLSAAGGGGAGIYVADNSTGVPRRKLSIRGLGGRALTGNGGDGGIAVLNAVIGNVFGGTGGSATAVGGGGGGGGAGGNTQPSGTNQGVGGTGGAGGAGRVYIYH